MSIILRTILGLFNAKSLGLLELNLFPRLVASVDGLSFYVVSQSGPGRPRCSADRTASKQNASLPVSI